MLEFTEFIGIISFSLSGFYIAVKNKLDILGILISSFLTALGGGIVRDTLVGTKPIALTTLAPSFIVFFMVILLIILKFHKKQHHDSKPLFIFIDSIGLVSFSITGSLIACQYNFAITGVVIISFITALGGGIFRDILINTVPYVLRGGFYGIISIIIGILIYTLYLFNSVGVITISLIFIFSISLRLLAFKKRWSLIKL